MSSTADYMGSAQAKCAKILLFSCWYSLLFWVVWWIGWLNSRSVTRNKQDILAILHFIHLIHPQEPQERVEDPYAATTAWHHLLMLVTNLVTHCCGMAFHSSTKSHCRSAIVVVLVTNTYSTPKLIPKVFNWVEVWTHGRPFHSLPDGVLNE